MKYIITLLLTLYALSLGAQEVEELTKFNSFQLDFGLNQLKEANLHPKVHSGLLYGLTYEHTRQRYHISNYKIGLRYSRLKTKFEQLSASANVQLFGHYNFLFEINKKNRLTYFVGPEIQLNYNLSLYPNWDESHLYWGSSMDLGIKNKLTLQITDQQTLAIDLGVSIFSVFSRPESDRQYKIDDISMGGIIAGMHKNLEAGTINKSISVILQAEYQFHISKEITQAICYSYNYRRIKGNDGNPFQNSIHNIGLKIYF